MEIKIDHKAVREMFDKDHEFEVLVKKNILETSLKHQTWKIVDEKVRSVIGNEIRNVNDTLLTGTYPRVLNPFIEARIKESLERSLDKTINDYIDSKLKTIRDDMKKEIDNRAEYIIAQVDEFLEKTINHNMAMIINDKVNEKIKNVIDGLEKTL